MRPTQLCEHEANLDMLRLQSLSETPPRKGWTRLRRILSRKFVIVKPKTFSGRVGSGWTTEQCACTPTRIRYRHGFDRTSPQFDTYSRRMFGTSSVIRHKNDDQHKAPWCYTEHWRARWRP